MKLFMPVLALMFAANLVAQNLAPNPDITPPLASTSPRVGPVLGNPSSALLPTAVDDEYKVLSGELLTVAAPGVLANDSGLALLSILPDNGTGQGSLVLLKDGALNYQSLPGFAGEDVFTYQVMDANGVIATAQIHFYCGIASPLPAETKLAAINLHDAGTDGAGVNEAASCSAAIGFAPWLMLSLVGLASVRIRRARA